MRWYWRFIRGYNQSHQMIDPDEYPVDEVLRYVKATSDALGWKNEDGVFVSTARYAWVLIIERSVE